MQQQVVENLGNTQEYINEFTRLAKRYEGLSAVICESLTQDFQNYGRASSVRLMAGRGGIEAKVSYPCNSNHHIRVEMRPENLMFFSNKQAVSRAPAHFDKNRAIHDIGERLINLDQKSNITFGPARERLFNLLSLLIMDGFNPVIIDEKTRMEHNLIFSRGNEILIVNFYPTKAR